MKGILLICVEEQTRTYIQMAYNLALSIKHSSDIPITLIANEFSEETLTPKQKKVFDAIIPPDYADYHEDYIMNPFMLKTRIWKYTLYDSTLYLDVDSFFLYDYKSIEKLFHTLRTESFHIQEVKRWSLDDAHKSDMVWTKPDKKEQLLPKLWQLYSIKEENQYPEYNSSLIWFKNTKRNEKYFERVAQNYLDRKHDFYKIGTNYPDELAWNLASAQMKHYTRIPEFKPMYFDWENKHKALDVVSQKYYFWGMASGYHTSKHIMTYQMLVNKARREAGENGKYIFNMRDKIYHRK